MGKFSIEIIPDFFAHKLEGEPLIAVPPRFGLIDKSADRWRRFRAKLAELNANAPAGERYKAVFCIRHGQGFHNVAEAKYGTEAWDDYWSKLEGDGELVWGPDPELTSIGLAQAADVHAMWVRENTVGLGMPRKIHSSPFVRALRTGQIAFDGLLDDDTKRWLIVEMCREENGVHTCDKRRARAEIAADFPTFPFEDGFTEADELWDADVRETKAQVAARAAGVLERLFQENWAVEGDDHVLAITAHSGFINGILLALGRRPYALPTGGVLPLVLKATRLDEEEAR